MKKINNINWLRVVTVTMSIMLVALFAVSCDSKGDSGKTGAKSGDVGAPRGKESSKTL